jgi:alpha-galactosidase
MVGGGSVTWAPSLVRDMLLTPALSDAEFVLLDINKKASDLTKTFLEKLARELGLGARFVSTTRRESLRGAQYVIIAISTGGLNAMAHDLAIPEQFGIYHTVGDTTGPGGWARLIRNFDVFVSLAGDINRYAPGAVVLNYTNPMTTLTDVLARLCKGPVVGLCHGLFENLERLVKLYGLNGESELSVKYAGINHFFWTTKAPARGVDVLADLTRRTRRKTLGEVFAGKEAATGGVSQLEVRTELFRLTGVLPYLGNRHICEFLPCYITSLRNIEAYGLKRTSIATRKHGFKQGRAELVEMVRGEIPSRFRVRSRETAADMIAAHAQGKAFFDVGNVPNVGQIDNLPRGLVVETAVRVDSNGFTPLTFGSLPRMVHGLIEPYSHLFPMVVNACFQRDRKLALQALRLDPVCARLNGQQVIDLGEKLLAAHKRYITVF